MKNLSKKIVIGNWKMNLNYKESIALSKNVQKELKGKKLKNEVVIFR